MSKIKITSLMAILILVVVFTLQNTEQVDIRFLLWHLSLSRSLMLFLVFTIGLLAGFVLSMHRQEKKDHNDPNLFSD